jgi:hypothetical protein
METTMAPRQRKLRNYLLDAPLQLRFTAVLVLATLLGAGLLGIFLARALNRLSEQAERAVAARAAAAQASHELGNASLSKTLLERFNDPEFTAQLERQSRAIDAASRPSRSRWASSAAGGGSPGASRGWCSSRSVFAWRCCSWASSSPPHRRAGVPGPAAAERHTRGRREVPRHGLRDGDELRELFDAAASLVKTSGPRTRPPSRPCRRARRP